MNAVLADVLSRGYATIPWHDAPPVPPQATGLPSSGTPTAVHVGSSVFSVDHMGSIRHRDGCAVVFLNGRVHLLVASGEVVLDDAEEQALRASWSSL